MQRLGTAEVGIPMAGGVGGADSNPASTRFSIGSFVELPISSVSEEDVPNNAHHKHGSDDNAIS